MPFIDELLQGINTIICDLQPQQVEYKYFANMDTSYPFIDNFRFKHFTKQLVT